MADDPATMQDDEDSEVEVALDLQDVDTAPDVEPVDVHDHDEVGAPEE